MAKVKLFPTERHKDWKDIEIEVPSTSVDFIEEVILNTRMTKTDLIKVAKLFTKHFEILA